MVNMEFIDIKVILLGDVNVGKTSIFMRFLESKWNRQYHQNTIGFVYKTIKLASTRGGTWNMGIWDTAGSERFAALTTMYYRDANYAILCFDPSVNRSWERVKFWASEVKKVTDSKLYICATKKDLIDEGKIQFNVDKTEVDLLVKEINARYIDVSSKTGENIITLFQNIVDDCAIDHVFLSSLSERRQESNLSLSHYQLRQQISEKYIKSESYCCNLF